MTAAYDQEPQFKQQFATFLHQGFTPFIAALKIWPDHAGFCYDISEKWQLDSYVQQCIDLLKTKDKKEKEPPTKADFVKKVEDAANGMDDDNKIKAFRLVAEMSGFIERAAAPSVVGNQTINNPVLIVRDHGTDAEWEERAKAQQNKLIEHVP